MCFVHAGPAYVLNLPPVSLRIVVEDSVSSSVIGLGAVDLGAETLLRKPSGLPREVAVHLGSEAGASEACGVLVLELETVRCQWGFVPEE